MMKCMELFIINSSVNNVFIYGVFLEQYSR